MPRICCHCDYKGRSSYCGTCNDSGLIQEKPCNLCGDDMTMINGIDNGDAAGLKDVSVMGGYNSYHLFDLNNYKFSFCEKCLRKLFEQCVIKPKITDYTTDENISWDEDQKAYEYRDWANSAKFHEAYLKRRCNTIKDCPNEAIYSIQLDEDEITITEQGVCKECAEDKDFFLPHNGKLIKFVSNQVRPFL